MTTTYLRFVALACGSLALDFCLSAAIAAPRPFALDDVTNVATVGSPVFAPDGESIAYVLTSNNYEYDKQVSRIWRVSWDGKSRKELKSPGPSSDWLPKWSPNGKWLAFLSNRNDSLFAQVWVMPSHGGKVRQLSHFKSDISEFVWSPDSKRIGIVALDQELQTTGAAKPIEIDRFFFKDDDTGYLTNRYKHVYVFDIDTRRVEQVTQGNHNEELLSWSPDGKWLAYVTKRSDPDRHVNFDIYLSEPKAGAVEQQLTTFAGIDSDPYWETTPAWSPDSKSIAYLQGGEQKWMGYAPAQLAVIDVDSKQSRIPANLDRNFYKAKWSVDGKSIYTLVEQSRNTYLARVDVASGALQYLTTGKRFDVDVDVAANGRVALLGGDDHHPPVISSVDSSLHTLSDHNQWLREMSLATAEDIQFTSRDGTEIHAMLLRPVGYQAGKKYPTILRLHGGPVYQFSHEFMADWQYFAAQGYAVVVPNPRGSSGRGFEFSKAIYADWGNKDTQDALAAIDHVVKLGIADPDKLYVGGWSYGGILTNYVIAQDSRFKAAFSGAGSSNTLAMYGHDEYVRETESELGKPWEHLDTYLKLSAPFLHADRIKTPTLFLCAQLDFNVPCLGAEQMYQALQSERVPTRLIIYPDQHHGLDVPSYVQHRLQKIVEWLRKF